VWRGGRCVAGVEGGRRLDLTAKVTDLESRSHVTEETGWGRHWCRPAELGRRWDLGSWPSSMIDGPKLVGESPFSAHAFPGFGQTTCRVNFQEGGFGYRYANVGPRDPGQDCRGKNQGWAGASHRNGPFRHLVRRSGPVRDRAGRADGLGRWRVCLGAAPRALLPSNRINCRGSRGGDRGGKNVPLGGTSRRVIIGGAGGGDEPPTKRTHPNRRDDRCSRDQVTTCQVDSRLFTQPDP
jgi:hypothetical protein